MAFVKSKDRLRAGAMLRKWGEGVIAQKWNCKTHEYEPFMLPYDAVLFSVDLNKMVACASCGKYIEYGKSYTSLEIHNSAGIGYAVCGDCYNEEWKKRSDSNAE